MTSVDLSKIEGKPIKRGSHSSPSNGCCVMEMVAYAAGEKHTDRPACACPLITSFAISLNDSMRTDDEREALRPLIIGIAGSRGSSALELRRAHVIVYWFVRVALPENFEFIGELSRAEDVWPVWLAESLRASWAALKPHCAALRAVSPITDRTSALAAREAVRAAREAARDALDALAALAARDALDALAALAALDALDARDALDALAALDALDARDALDALVPSAHPLRVRAEEFRTKRTADLVALIARLCEMKDEEAAA